MIINRLHAKYHCFGTNGLGVTEIQRGSNILKRTIVPLPSADKTAVMERDTIVRFKKACQRLASNISVLLALINMNFCMWSYISNVPTVLYISMLQEVYFNCNG